MVEAIRRFRPTVIVSRWNGTPADGHGHHQFAGYLAPLAFEAAADPDRFPEQIDRGLEPWQAEKLYVSVRGDDDGNVLVINTGEYDIASGRSYFEIGMHGRSQQKTQQMGSLELKGRQESRLQLVAAVADPAEDEGSVFDGIDTSIRGISRFEPSSNPDLDQLLSDLFETLSVAAALYRPSDAGWLTLTMNTALGIAREARQAAGSFDARRLLDEKIEDIELALVLASGIRVEALAEFETLIPGQTFNVAIRLFDPGVAPVEVTDAWLRVPEDWTAEGVSNVRLQNEAGFRRREQPGMEIGFAVEVSENAAPTQPYWLERPRAAFNYDWSLASDARTAPFAEPLLVCRAVTADWRRPGHDRARSGVSRA